MAVVGCNTIIDIYHKTSVSSWTKVANDGIIAVIHKATEGTFFHDSKYHTRKAEAKAKGLLWGAYHFSNGDDGAKQADFFLDFCQPADDELISLDWEPSSHPKDKPKPPDMTYVQAIAFIERVEQRIGRLPVIYGGHLVKELMTGHGGSKANKCPLWLAEYPAASHDRPQHQLPEGWSRWTLWQYTDGDNGPDPHSVNGIGDTDRDTFNGAEAELRQNWPLTWAAGHFHPN